MALPDLVLLDTSALYALAAEEDKFHHQAVRIFEGLIDREQALVTTSYVASETIALVINRLGFSVMDLLWTSLLQHLETYWVDPGIHREAWNELKRNQGKGLSFVDWTTVLAARQLRAQVFTFDRGFPAEGATVIP